MCNSSVVHKQFCKFAHKYAYKTHIRHQAMSAQFQMSWIYWSLVVIYCITVISIIGVVLSENRNPLKSLAWITVLLLLPVGGIILYIFFGRSIKNTHMISRRNKRRLRQSFPATDYTEPPADITTESRQQIELGRSLTGSHYLSDNRIQIFHNGTDKFESLLRDIAGARRFIHIQYYIFDDDNLGNRIKDALIARAKEGVKVRIIYDHIGSLSVSRRFFREMRQAGIEAYPFFRVAFPPFATRINWRNHRKLCVIDGAIGYIGGMNIADRYVNGGKFKRWRDTHMRITGPGVTALHYSFAVDWSFMGQPLIEEQLDIKPYTSPDNAGVQLITSGPTSEWSNVAMLMLKAIGNAKKRVFIQTPYFLPTESLLRSLQAAALSRVDVRVMLPRRSDSSILTYASYSYIMECLRAGIKIYLYDGGMLHSKTMMIDDNFSAIGSANIDFRSFEHNFEATMFIYSDDANARLRKQFLADQQLCQRVSPSVWRKRSKVQKAKESLTRLLSPIL